MKRRKKTFTVVIVIVLAAAMAAAGLLYSNGYFGSKSSSASSTSYTIDKLTTGDLEKSITGTGTLSAGGSATETASLALTIDTVKVAVGQTVKTGDTLATIDASSLTDTITSLQSDIATIDSSLAKLATSASVSKVTTQVSGRVKQILCKVGSDVAGTMLKSGGLITLSTDGKMKVVFTLSSAKSTSVGKTVKVITGGKTYKGLVEELSSDGKTCTVTLTDNGTSYGAAATVYNTSGAELGSGKLAINRPYLVTATSGTVSKIYVSLNAKVNSRTSLLYLTGISLTDEYTQKQTERAEKVAELLLAKNLLKTCTITATEDGTVQSLNMADGQAVTSGQTLATLLTAKTINLEMSIDELDINSVSVGQTATVTIDAISGKTYTGTVASISQIGTANNGVTTYTVTLQLAADSAFKVGMNSTATITIEKKTGVLLLPLEALQSLQGKEYVWLYTGTLPTDSSADPGTKTVVTTGLSNATYVEVTSGLTAADQVVVVRTKSTSTATTSKSSSGSLLSGLTGGTGGQGGPPAGN